MTGVVLSARAVQRGAERPLMDAIAHGRREQDLIFNRRPGIDSIVELVPLLADGADDCKLQLLAALCNGLCEHNVEQLRAERLVVGWANALSIDLHALELRGHTLQIGVREIAKLVRVPLGVLLEEPRAELLEVLDAGRAIDAVLARAPRAQMFAGSLENLLGGRKYRLLVVLEARRRRALLAASC